MAVRPPGCDGWTVLLRSNRSWASDRIHGTVTCTVNYHAGIIATPNNVLQRLGTEERRGCHSSTVSRFTFTTVSRASSSSANWALGGKTE
jgi:hypothetical protein